MGLLLTYAADPSVVDLTRLNETMVKVLKGEITNFDDTDDENDDISISLSSPTMSADELEQDEKHFSESSSSTNISKFEQKKVIIFFLFFEIIF